MSNMLVIGHRGAKGLKKENTEASFKAALENGVDAIEFDIRTTKDGKIILNHDPIANGLIVSLSTYAELRKVNPDMLTLEQALKIINNRCRLVIEVKRGSDMSTLIQELAKLKLPKNVNFSSFNFSILKELRKAFPDVQLTVNDRWSGARASHRARILDTKYITMQQRWLWNGFVWSMARGGYKLAAYPLNYPKRAKKWAKYGLYAAITDRPDLFNQK